MSRKIAVSGKKEALETFIYNARGLHFRVFISYNGGTVDYCRIELASRVPRFVKGQFG